MLFSASTSHHSGRVCAKVEGFWVEGKFTRQVMMEKLAIPEQAWTQVHAVHVIEHGLISFLLNSQQLLHSSMLQRLCCCMQLILPTWDHHVLSFRSDMAVSHTGMTVHACLQ